MNKFDLLTAVAEAVQKFIKCPVCLETVRTPFKQCMNGHNVCSECTKSQRGCPTCKTAFLYNNPFRERELLQALPKLCRYYKEGCRVEVRNSVEHQRFCRYRPAGCRQNYCKAVVPLNKLVEHYKSKHNNHLIIGQNYEELSGVFDINVPNEDHTLISIDDMNSFSWIIFRIEKARNIIEVKLLNIWGDPEKIETCFGKLKIGDGKPYEYTYCFPHMTTNALEDNKKESKPTDPEGEFYLRMPLDVVLKEIADQNGKLKYKITIDAYG